MSYFVRQKAGYKTTDENDHDLCADDSDSDDDPLGICPTSVGSQSSEIDNENLRIYGTTLSSSSQMLDELVVR